MTSLFNCLQSDRPIEMVAQFGRTSTRRLPRRRGLAPTTLLLSSSVQKLLGWRGVERWRPREPFVLPFPHLPHQWPQTTMVINSSACRINSSGFRRTWNRSQSRRTCRASRATHILADIQHRLACDKGRADRGFHVASRQLSGNTISRTMNRNRRLWSKRRPHPNPDSPKLFNSKECVHRGRDPY